MSQDAFLLELSGAIYDAVQCRAGWPEVLGTLRDLLGAVDCAIVSIEKSSPRFGFAAAASHGVVTLPARNRNYGFMLDPRLHGGLHRAPGERFIADGRAAETDGWAQDLAALLGDGAAGPFLGLIIENDRNHFAALTVTRSAHSAAFCEGEEALLARLHQHLWRGCALERRLNRAEHERRAARTALDRLPAGVVVVDGGGQIRFCNRFAEMILAERDGLVLGNDGLKAEAPREMVALCEAIRRASTAQDGCDSVTVLSVDRPSMSRPLELLVAPLANGVSDPEATAGALIFVSDPERRPRMAADGLTHLYGFSRAEAELAAELASGKTLAQFADERARNIETARKTLKRIFAKTNTGRQAELVGRLLTGPLIFVNGGAIDD